MKYQNVAWKKGATTYKKKQVIFINKCFWVFKNILFIIE